MSKTRKATPSNPAVEPPTPDPIKVIGVTFFEDFTAAMQAKNIEKKKRSNSFLVELKALAIETRSVEVAKKLKNRICDGKILYTEANLAKPPIRRGQFIILKPDLSSRTIDEAFSDILAVLKENNLLADIIAIHPGDAEKVAQKVVRAVHRDENPRNKDSLHSIRFGLARNQRAIALVFAG